MESTNQNVSQMSGTALQQISLSTRKKQIAMNHLQNESLTFTQPPEEEVPSAGQKNKGAKSKLGGDGAACHEEASNFTPGNENTCKTDSRRELRASPSKLNRESDRNPIDSWRNMKDSEHADQPPQLPEAEPVQFLDSKNIMKRIFYQNNEATVEKQYFDQARKVKINLQQMEFKSISLNEEKMVISLDLIEMHDQDTDKKRTMISMQVQPSGRHVPELKAGRLAEIERMCQPQNQSFEDAYSKLNERFINEIIDQESERQRGREQEAGRCPTCGSSKSARESRGAEQDEQNFLLIGESSL